MQHDDQEPTEHELEEPEIMEEVVEVAAGSEDEAVVENVEY